MPGDCRLAAKGSITAASAPYSLHNADIGYCQGLNFVAGFLLVRRIRAASSTRHPLSCLTRLCLQLMLSEEQAFWVLDVLTNEILPQDYYNGGLVGVRAPKGVGCPGEQDGRTHLRSFMLQVHADQRVLAHLVSEVFPDISEVLAEAGIEISVRRSTDWSERTGRPTREYLLTGGAQVVSVEWRVSR